MKAKSAAPRKTARKAPPQTVNLDRLSESELEALPEEVFLASLAPHARKIALAAYAMKGVFRK